MTNKLTKEQIKIRAWGDEFNKKVTEPTESAQDIIDVLPNQQRPAVVITKQQEDFILMRENE